MDGSALINTPQIRLRCHNCQLHVDMHVLCIECVCFGAYTWIFFFSAVLQTSEEVVMFHIHAMISYERDTIYFFGSLHGQPIVQICPNR